MRLDWSKNGYALANNYCQQKFWVPNHAKGVVRRKGILDRELLSCLADLVESGKVSDGVCLDIGANIGNHTLFFSKLFQEVIAFEPLADLLPLADNLKLNRTRNVKLVYCGLSNVSRVAQIHVSPHVGMGASTLCQDLSRENSFGKKVQLELGDDILKGLTNIAFIKIDVEGHEAEVLCGLRTTIITNRPVISFEWNNARTKKGFADLGVLPGLLDDYSLWGVEDAASKSLGGQLTTRIFTKIKSIFGKPVYNLVEFEATRNFGNVLAFPKSAKNAFSV